MSEEFEFLLENFTLIALLIVSTAISSVISSKGWSKYFPESGAAMIFGIIVGLLFQLLSLFNLKQEFEFQPELFYFIILPPIIFDSGYSMKKRNFFLNMGTILLHAVFGTLICAVVFGYGLYFFASIGAINTISSHHALESLQFGSLMSATDTVSILSVMGSPGCQVDSTLYALIFGESVLNDAVAIVLFKTLSSFHGNSFAVGDLFKSIGMFTFVSVGAVVIGTGVGMLASMFFKRFSNTLQKNPHFEISALVMFAYLSYLVCELAETSGVMGLFFTGVTLKHYAWYSLSHESQVSSENLFRMLSFLAETFCFVYLGINITESAWSSFFSFKFDPALVFISVLMCFVSRGVGVFGLNALANLKRKQKIPWNFQTLQWFAGLKGSVAFSLALMVDSKHRDHIITTTLMVVLFTILVEGSLTAPLIRFLKVQKKDTGSPVRESVDIEEVIPLTQSPGFLKSQMSAFHVYWRWFDDKFLKPYVGGKPRRGATSPSESNLELHIQMTEVNEMDDEEQRRSGEQNQQGEVRNG